VEGLQYLDKIQKQLTRGDNVILFANHQTEPDPQVIGLLLDKTHPRMAEEIIFVAGNRVTMDPLAIPFSMGCNLLCIYSKKHIEHPPEKKEEKLLHNQRVLQKLRELLTEGGKCIYVAPSGGRDRLNDQGQVVISPFDPQSIELFRIIAKQAKRPAHFYPLALATHHLLPPPNTVEKELGERREAQCTPVHLMFDDEIDIEAIPLSDNEDKEAKRAARAKYVWEIVQRNYARLMQP
jgi:glycerol-3-phosphate O-acyltransferase